MERIYTCSDCVNCIREHNAGDLKCLEGHFVSFDLGKENTCPDFELPKNKS